jgi:cation diffusion facilitator family transporter
MSDKFARNKIRIAAFSLGIAFIVLALKLLAYRETQSLAVLSDALETIINVITAAIALFVVRIGSEPADENHPYGHGKAESFSAAFEGGLVVSAGLFILYESALAFFEPASELNLSNGLLWMGLATIANLVTGLYLRNRGQKYQSASLAASGAHILSDVKTTVAVIAGLYLSRWTGALWLDPLIASLVGVHLLYEGYSIVRGSISILTDEIDESALRQLSRCFENHRQDGIIDIHKLKMIRSGSFHHIDAHLVVPQFWDVSTAHSTAHNFERKVVDEYLYDAEIAFHMDPCEKKYCSQCALKDCPIRANSFTKQKKFELKHVISEALKHK